MSSKSLRYLTTNEQIELSQQNKERLVFWIQHVEAFQRYC